MVDSRGFESVKKFEIVQEDIVGRAQRSVEGWVIFVTNLHEEMTEDDLYDKFADFGPIRELRMPLDHRTGYVKGYALLEFGSHAEAKAAIDNMNGQPVMGQELACDFAFVRATNTMAGSRMKYGDAFDDMSGDARRSNDRTVISYD